MSGEYWPWWLGAIVLGGVGLGFAWFLRAGLGVSGVYSRLLNWREEREAEKVRLHIESRRVESGQPLPTGALPVSLGLVFLVSLSLGGALAALSSGGLAPSSSLDPAQSALLGGDVATWLALAGGGFLVGFGTKMGAGCTSGHGLFGCARLQPGSLLGTASFFGAAVLLSFVLAGM